LDALEMKISKLDFYYRGHVISHKEEQEAIKAGVENGK